jgi:hypothetical protein
MFNKQRIPDLIFIVALGLFLTLLNYIDQIKLIADYPFIFLLIAYFVGRAVTWYVINKHMENGENEEDGN